MNSKKKLALVGFCIVATLALDLWTKAWAWENLRESRQTVTVIEQFFYFSFSFNTGSAFGFLRDFEYSRPLFVLATVLTILYMGYIAYRLPAKHYQGMIAIGLIIGGALGNLHDRFVRQIMQQGELVYGVVDFIKVYYWKHRPWPTFNIADVGLTAGAILLIIYFVRHGESTSAPAQPSTKST